MNSRDAKKKIEALMTRQEKGDQLPCPRCGKKRMDTMPVRNALSRNASIYVCDWCGVEEAMEDFCGAGRLPLAEWAAASW